MSIDFSRGAKLCKALSDETRVKIVHILSCGERCACDIQEYFELSQPTLSHHLAILADAGIVVARAEGKWVHYRLAADSHKILGTFVSSLFRGDETCLCKKIDASGKKRSCDER